MAPNNPLSPASIVARMAEALPTHDKDDTTSDLSSSLDAIALFTHACMATLDFKLVSLDEDDKTSADCANFAPRLPPTWSASLNSRNFVYSHIQSSMKFIIRVDRLGSKIEIRGLATGDERIARFDFTAREYISPSALPLRIPFVNQEDGTPAEDRGTNLHSKLQTLFISESRISDLASLFKISVIQKLAPSLIKEGYQEDPDDRAARQDAESSARSGARPHPFAPGRLPEPARPSPYPAPDNFAPPPPRPIPAGDFPPPGFEDEYEINRPPRGRLIDLTGRGGHNPYGIGGSDLYPAGLGPDDPLRSSFVPGRLPGQGPSGGMHPTFDDPLFQGPRGPGNPDFDSQAPPGARWDLIGPGGAPRFGGGRPGGRGFGGAGGGFGSDSFGDII